MDLLNNSLNHTDHKISINNEDHIVEETESLDCDTQECITELTQSAFIDPNIQYQLHQENTRDGQITYRVVPISTNFSKGGSHKSNSTGPIISDVNFSSQQNQNNSLIQSSIQNNPNYMTLSSLDDIRSNSNLTLYSSEILSHNSQINDLINSNALFPNSMKDKTSLLSTNNGGHLLLMMSPELLQNHKVMNPHQSIAAGVKQEIKGFKDEKRRSSHNEVERRRRDKINTWILKLSKIVPECGSDQTKQGQSKGGILAKTVEYIHDLKRINENLFTALKDCERMSQELDRLKVNASKTGIRPETNMRTDNRSEIAGRDEKLRSLTQENAVLRAFIKQHFPNVEIRIARISENDNIESVENIGSIQAVENLQNLPNNIVNQNAESNNCEESNLIGMNEGESLPSLGFENAGGNINIVKGKHVWFLIF
ncbi:unnamed protein product [Gordionus sp. m RMFG-2023]